MIAYVIGYVVAVVLLFLMFRKIFLLIAEGILPPEFTEPSLDEKEYELNYLRSQLKTLDQEVKITETLVGIDEELIILRDRLKMAENKRSNKGD